MSKPELKEDHARSQAQLQLESVKEMVAALECDYDRLEELKDERADLLSEAEDDSNVERNDAIETLQKWDDENAEELKQLMEAAGDCESREDAEQRIHEDALEVSVKSDWHSPGEKGEDSEFLILLCTGGPAVRIIGELDQYKQPDRAWLEYQDWGTPWTEYITTGDDHDALLTYARCFYFGE